MMYVAREPPVTGDLLTLEIVEFYYAQGLDALLCGYTLVVENRHHSRSHGSLVLGYSSQQDAVHGVGPTYSVAGLQCNQSTHCHLPDRHHFLTVNQSHYRPFRFAHCQMPRITAGADVICRNRTWKETELRAARTENAAGGFDY